MRTLGTVAAGALALILATWAADRTLPVTQVRNVALAPARAGQALEVEASVVRHRLCLTTVERFVFDAEGHRFMLPDLDFTPHRLGAHTYRDFWPIDARATPGPATAVLSLRWRCNPVHWVWPIPDTVELPATILEAPAAPCPCAGRPPA